MTLPAPIARPSVTLCMQSPNHAIHPFEWTPKKNKKKNRYLHRCKHFIVYSNITFNELNKIFCSLFWFNFNKSLW